MGIFGDKKQSGATGIGNLESASVQNPIGTYNGLMGQTIDADTYRRISEMQKQQQSMINNHIYADISADSDPVSSSQERYKMLGMRMRWRRDQYCPFKGLQTFLSESGEKVLLAFVKGEGLVTLEDDAKLYPSDTLITQLRLLE